MRVIRNRDLCEMPRLFVSEIFSSIQGEGLLVGVPSTFVRLSGCNLRCRWCDTPYTSWEASGSSRDLEELLAEVHLLGHRHVVLTGGEPLIQPAVVALSQRLRAAGHHLTIETAGTLFRPVEVDLLSISPKLTDSTPAAPAAWAARHERDRLDVPALLQLMALGDWQLKLVAGSEADLVEIDALIASLGPLPPDRILLMPEGRSTAEIDAHAPLLIAACKTRGWRFCDRLHLRLFGNTPGT